MNERLMKRYKENTANIKEKDRFLRKDFAKNR